MKKLFQMLLALGVIFTILFIACNKDEKELQAVNIAPVAEAGNFQMIVLPQDSCFLDGRGSTDKDGSVQGFLWEQIDGPSSATILVPAAARTLVTNLVAGDYKFQLTVTDDDGMSAKDVVTVQVASGIINSCDIASRPKLNATLTEIGDLSVPRTPVVAAAGGKIVFAGGVTYSNNNGQNGSITGAVDIYDVNTHIWSTAQLSKPRDGIAAIAAGNKIFFAGGTCNCYEDSSYDNVDIYDVSTNTWTLAHLTEPRSYLTAAVVGNKVLFAGGASNSWASSRTVDIYDLSSNTWTTAQLSFGRWSISAVTVGDNVYFAGGDDFFSSYNSIDIYDNLTNSWSVSSLQNLSGAVSAAVVGGKIYWAGLYSQQLGIVEIWNTNNNTISQQCLSYPRYSPTAIVNNNQILFFGDLSNHPICRFDIYNSVDDNWGIGLINQSLSGSAVISVNNNIFIAGGTKSDGSTTGKVYILRFNGYE